MKEKSHFIELFWEIYDLLMDFFRGRRYSTREIAARFDRSERTARRYLEIVRQRVRLEKDRDGRYYIPGRRNKSVPCEILFTEERIEALRIVREEFMGTEIGDIIEEILADMGVELEGFTPVPMKDIDYDVLITLGIASRNYLPVRVVLSDKKEYEMHVHSIHVGVDGGDGYVVEAYLKKGNGSQPFIVPVSHIVYAQILEEEVKR